MPNLQQRAEEQARIAKRISDWAAEGKRIEAEATAHRKALLTIVAEAKRSGIPASVVADELGISKQALSLRLSNLKPNRKG